LGFRTILEAVGHVEVLDTRGAVTHWKAKGLDISPILAEPVNHYGQTFHQSVGQDHGLDEALDRKLIELASAALDHGERVSLDLPIRNVNRTVGTMLGSELTRRYGAAGLPDATIDIEFTGSAGQSLGAFMPHGISIRLTGDANDYVGKGLSGGRIVIRPSTDSAIVAHDNVIAGNVIGYGATAGQIFLSGTVGERFCVRNSGADAVVEGVGDHGCEYMSGGRAVILGVTGRNFGAGMSGGAAYVFDEDGLFADRVNFDMVALEALEGDDAAGVRSLIEQHVELTGSRRGAELLGDWEANVKRFHKVMPIDYSRVLAAFEQASSAGLDEAATLALVMGGK
jgi:glutamate synthase (NADPH/NADH) large chain